MHQPNINHIYDLKLIYIIIDYFVNEKIGLAFYRFLNPHAPSEHHGR